MCACFSFEVIHSTSINLITSPYRYLSLYLLQHSCYWLIWLFLSIFIFLSTSLFVSLLLPPSVLLHVFPFPSLSHWSVCVCVSSPFPVPSLPPFSPPGPPAVLLSGGGWAGLPCRLGRWSGRGLAHVVRGGPRSLGSGHGELASGAIRRSAPGLEGRASPKDRSGCVCAHSRSGGNAQGIWKHGRAKLCHHMHDRCQSDPEAAKQDEVKQDVFNKWPNIRWFIKLFYPLNLFTLYRVTVVFYGLEVKNIRHIQYLDTLEFKKFGFFFS